MGRTVKVIFLLLFLSGGVSLAQPYLTLRAGESVIQTDPNYHDKLFKGPANNPTVDVKLSWADLSGSRYSQLYGNPQYGIAASVDFLNGCSYQQGNCLSNIYNIYGFFDRPIVNFYNFTFSYTLGLGLGYSRELYHPVNNPYNMIFGSPVTSHVSVGFDLFYTLRRGSAIGFGFYYNHNSNGSTQLPNCGYNGLDFALSYKFDTRRKPAQPQSEEEPRQVSIPRGFRYEIYAAGSMTCLSSEYFLRNEMIEDPAKKEYRFPLYPRFSFGASVLYRYCDRCSAGIGLDMTYLPCCRYLESLNRQFCPDYLDRYFPLTVGVSAMNEFHYYDFALRVNLGAYILKRDGLNYGCRLYEALSLRYNMPKFLNTFVFLGMRVHYFTAADCILLGIGKAF